MITKVIIIDKYPVARSGLSYVIQNKFRDVEIIAFNSPESYRDSPLFNNSDLVIFGLPQNASYSVSPHSFISDNRNSNFKTAHIIYDEEPEYNKVLRFLKIGVKGYLSKQNSVNNLIKCLEKVLKGELYLGSEIINLIASGDVSRENKKNYK